MKRWSIPAVFAAGAIAGCMAGGAPAPAQSPTGSPASSPFGDHASFAQTLAVPLVLDRADLRIGTTVQYRRVPTAVELSDLQLLPGLSRIVISLPAWPPDYAGLESLNQVPQGADVIVVLPGYPPTRASADVWNYVSAPIRLVIVVPEPPPNRAMIDDLNSMRRLERVIAQMDLPTRTGFERLQRPLSFRKVVD